MDEIQHKSSDSDSSVVLEGTPPKEDYNKTILTRSFVSKKFHSHHAIMSEPERPPSRKKDERESSLYHSSPTHMEKGTKSSVTEKGIPLNKSKFGKLSSSLPQAHTSYEKQTKKYGKAFANQSQAHSSSEKESDEDSSYRMRYRRRTIEDTDSDSSESMNGAITDTSEEALPCPKLASKVGKQRHNRNVILSSDSEASVTGNGDSLAMSNSPKLLKPSSVMGSYKKNEYMIESADSDTVDAAEKSSTIHDMSRSKYREKECFVVLSDSEESVINQNIEKLSISAESSLESTSDKNAVNSVSVEEIQVDSENENSSVLETSNLGTFPVQNKALKLLHQNSVKVNECIRKTVKEYDHASNDGNQEQTSNDSEAVQQARTKNKSKTDCAENKAHCNDSTLIVKEVSPSSLPLVQIQNLVLVEIHFKIFHIAKIC
jgi:hypothetical protein